MLPRFDATFYYCRSLKEIEITSSVETIGDHAFLGCWRLREVWLREGSKRIGICSFQQSSLVKVKLPCTVTLIDTGAFSECRSLSEMDLPQRLVELGEQSFLDCVSLLRIRAPASVNTIGAFAVARCLNLVSMEFELKREQAVRIGRSAFRTCKSLINVTISLSSLRQQEIIDISRKCTI